MKTANECLQRQWQRWISFCNEVNVLFLNNLKPGLIDSSFKINSHITSSCSSKINSSCDINSVLIIFLKPWCFKKVKDRHKFSKDQFQWLKIIKQHHNEKTLLFYRHYISIHFYACFIIKWKIFQLFIPFIKNIPEKDVFQWPLLQF